MKSVGELIKARRLELGLSAADLSRTVGVTPQAVWNWENDPERSPSREVLQGLASALQLTVDELLPDFMEGAASVEQELLAAYRQLSDQDRQIALRVVKALGLSKQ